MLPERRAVPDAAPRHARPFAAALLAAMTVCALLAVNPWPFSDWELFSRVRVDRQTAWSAVAVAADGRVVGIPADSLPHGRGGIAAAAARPAAARAAVCTSWLRAASAELATGVRSVRLYRLTWLLSDRRGRRAAPARRTPALDCGTRTARAG